MIKKKRNKIYGVLLDKETGKIIILAGPLGLEVTVDGTELIESRPITTIIDLWGICKALNENRLPSFDSQACMSKILEKYTPETLIYE